MIDYLSGAIPWLLRRSEMLIEHLRAVEIPFSIEKRIKAQIVQLEKTVAEISDVLNDPEIDNPDYTDQNLIRFRRLVRSVDDIESIFLPLVEGWGKDQEAAQQLITRICHETNLPSSIRPIIALYSWQYFFVLEYLQVIYIPRLESKFLLHLPDLYHELGHAVLEQNVITLWGNLEDQIRDYFDREHTRGVLERDPLALSGIYLGLADSWNRWLIEFTSDIIAAYLCGPAYAWSHIHLCASTVTTVYYPNAGEDSTHPADEARWRAIALTLEDMGYGAEVRKIEKRWYSLVECLGEPEPTNFNLAYPQPLLKAMQKQIKQGLKSLGVHFYPTSHAMQSNVFGPELSDLLNYAWVRYWQSPSDYAAWEVTALPI